MKQKEKLTLNEELSKMKNLIYNKNSSINEDLISQGNQGAVYGGAIGAAAVYGGVFGSGIPVVGTIIGAALGAGVGYAIHNWFSADSELTFDASKKYDIAMEPKVYDEFKNEKIKKNLPGLNILDDKKLIDYAKRIYNAVDGLGTDENAIMGVMGEIDSLLDISGLARHYDNQYNESLKDALEGDLSSSEMNSLKNLIAKDSFVIYDGKRIETKEDLEKAIGSNQSAPQNPNNQSAPQNPNTPVAPSPVAPSPIADNSGTSKSIQWINAPTLDDVINGKNIFIKRGMKGESVGQVQKAVAANIDDKFARETEYKVMGFQTANKMLKADGIVDKETAQLIVSKLGKIGRTQQNIAPIKQQPTAPIYQSTSQQAAAKQINQALPTEFSNNIAKFFVRNNGKKVIAKSKKEGGFTTDDIASIQKYIMDTYGVKYVLDRYIDKPTKDKLVYVVAK